MIESAPKISSSGSTPDKLNELESLVERLELGNTTEGNSFDFKRVSDSGRSITEPEKNYRTNSTIMYRSPKERKPMLELDPPLSRSTEPTTPPASPQRGAEDTEIEGARTNTPPAYVDPETKLSALFMEFFQSSLSYTVVLESALRGVLEYSNADHLYLIRKIDDGTLVLDASINKERTWSLLESVVLTDYDVSERFEGVKESRHSNTPVYLPKDDTPCSKASILCIPIILLSKYRACIYLTSNTTKNAFHHINLPVLTMLLTNLYSLQKIQHLKRSLVAIHKESLALPCLKGSSKVELQDTLQVYDSTSKKWSSSFVIHADHQLKFFSTPFETNPIRILSLTNIRNVRVTAQRNSHQEPIDLPVLPKNFEDYGLIYFYYDNQPVWLASQLLETAHHWTSSLLNSKRKGKPLKIPENIRINEVEVERGEIIGKGAAAVVYAGKFQHTRVAIKQLIDQFDRSEVKSFFDEMNILQKLHHPNIVSLFGGYITEEGKPCIVFEYALRGSLSTVLYDPLVVISDEMKLKILIQTIQALVYLHSFDPPIIHRDLKPANILVRMKSVFSCFD